MTRNSQLVFYHITVVLVHSLELFPMWSIDFTYYITGQHISNNKSSTKYNVSNIPSIDKNANLQVFKKYYENTKQIKH